MEKGYGNFAEVNALDITTRMACFYASARMSGLEVEWSTGLVRRQSGGPSETR